MRSTMTQGQLMVKVKVGGKVMTGQGSHIVHIVVVVAVPTQRKVL